MRAKTVVSYDNQVYTIVDDPAEKDKVEVLFKDTVLPFLSFNSALSWVLKEVVNGRDDAYRS